MSSIRSCRDPIVWQQSKRLAALVFKATDRMPRSEIVGLTAQMRRASVSIPSNIAQGYNRKTRPEYIRGLRIASGSQAELYTQWEIFRELEFLEASPQIESLLTEIDCVLFSLIRKLES